MPFYNNFNLISIHCPRTGGTAIHQALGQSVMYRDHSSWQDIRKRFPDVWDTAFIFATVRNPFDWLVSLYNYSGEWPSRAQSERPQLGAPVNIGGQRGLPKRTFNDYVKYPTMLVHESPFITQSQTIGPDIDFIIKFENLQEGFDKLCDKIGRPRSILSIAAPTPNRTKDYRPYYTPKLIQSVKDIFYKDLKRFNYTYDTYWNTICTKYNYLNKKEISND